MSHQISLPINRSQPSFSEVNRVGVETYKLFWPQVNMRVVTIAKSFGFDPTLPGNKQFLVNLTLALLESRDTL